MTTRMLALRSIAPLAAILLAVHPLASANAEAVKGGEALTKRATPSITHSTVTSTSMKCARCADTVATIPDRAIKGGGALALVTGRPPQHQIARHACPACGAKLEVKGQGKASTSVMKHQCKQCAPTTGASGAAQTK